MYGARFAVHHGAAGWVAPQMGRAGCWVVHEAVAVPNIKLKNNKMRILIPSFSLLFVIKINKGIDPEPSGSSLINFPH